MKQPPYSKLYNYISDEYLPQLTEAEIKTLLIINRKTIGWGRKRTKITRSYIMMKTGLSAKSVSRGIQLLESKKLIRVSDQHGKKYSVHKRKYADDLHFELHIPLRVKSTHTRVKFPNSLEYNLHIIKERDKRKQISESQKRKRIPDHERILQIISGQSENKKPPVPPVLPS